MALADLRLKFRQSKDYTQEMLIRDLIEYAQEMEKHVGRSGEWTPELRFGGATTGITYVSRRGNWSRFGQFVFFDFEVRLSSKGTAIGNAEIHGLPYGAPTNRPISAYPTYAIAMAMAADAQLEFLGYGASGIKSMILRQRTNTTTSTVTDANFTDTSRFIVSGNYITNDP
jgi:hypothetical protein